MGRGLNMRCHICNANLKPEEVQWNNEHEDWDPCRKCQIIIDEVFEPLPEDYIDLEEEENEDVDETFSEDQAETA